MNLFSYNLPTYKITKPIRLIELFAGVGSQAKALTNLGVEFEHYKVIEFDKFAIRSYNAVHNTNFETTDITQITGVDLEIRERDKYEYILTYSFPCQDISLAGTRAGIGKGTRSGLLWEVERLLNELEELPQVLLMENVPQVIGKDNVQHFAKWVEFLESKGYSNYTDTLNAKDYGVAQNRNRTFMLSILGEYNYNFPYPKRRDKTFLDVIDKEVGKDLFITDYFIEQIKQTKYRDNTIHVEDTSNIANKIYERNVVMDYRYDEGLRVRKDNLIPTLTTLGNQSISGAPIFYIDKELRFISPKEAWRAMGFTDEDFYKAEKVNSNAQLYKQAGNSIVVDVLENIFKQLL